VLKVSLPWQEKAENGRNRASSSTVPRVHTNHDISPCSTAPFTVMPIEPPPRPRFPLDILRCEVAEAAAAKDRHCRGTASVHLSRCTESNELGTECVMSQLIINHLSPSRFHSGSFQNSGSAIDTALLWTRALQYPNLRVCFLTRFSPVEPL
jgi:hypothetical protein